MNRPVKLLTGTAIIFLVLTTAWFSGGSPKQADSLPADSSQSIAVISEGSSSGSVSLSAGASVSSSDEPESDPPAPDPSAPDPSTPDPSTPEVSAPPLSEENRDSVVNSTSSANPQLTCTISIDCGTVLDHLDVLAPGKSDLIPQDGMILGSTVVAISNGDTVLDVLERITRDRKIHLEFEKTPAYQSVYIEGIGNLYEFDCGDLSGWTYSVNGIFSSIGCSQEPVNNGDIIRWYYTCDLGNDVGAPEA